MYRPLKKKRKFPKEIDYKKKLWDDPYGETEMMNETHNGEQEDEFRASIGIQTCKFFMAQIFLQQIWIQNISFTARSQF